MNAAKGLASLANVFTDAVLVVLCEEYSNFNRKEDDREELRMKLGEVLMRVTKLLGKWISLYCAFLRLKNAIYYYYFFFFDYKVYGLAA